MHCFISCFPSGERMLRLVLAAAAFGIWNPLAVKTLYVMGNPGKFVACVLGYAVLGSVVWILLQKGKKPRIKISPWIVFAVLLILVLQVVYYEIPLYCNRMFSTGTMKNLS